MARYKTRPVEVEAVQWNKPGDHPAVYTDSLVRPDYVVQSKQGIVAVNPGDFIIAEPDGSGHYPCHPAVFRTKYEPV